MTTANSSSRPGDDKNNKQESGSKPTKKTKSAGFIETAGFKPNWLETGPLSPEMLISIPAETSPTAEPDSGPQHSAPPDPSKQADLPDTTSRSQPAAYTQGSSTDLSAQLSSEDLEAIQKLLEKYGSKEITAADEPIASQVQAAVPAIEEILKDDSNAIGEEELDLSSITQDESLEEEVVLAALMQSLESTSAATAKPAPEIGKSEQPAAPRPAAAKSGRETAGVKRATPPLAVSEPEPTTALRTETVKVAQPVKKKRDRLSWVLFLVGLILLVAAAVVYFINPFTRLALSTASLARPVASAGLPAPSTISGDWCVRGDFLGQNAASLQLVDTGNQGDILSQDRVYSLEYPIPWAGTYQWQVVSCADPTITYPAEPAWLRTETDGQSVTFLFDSNEREDPLFFPIPFVVSALDSSDSYRAIGSFQDWNPDDRNSELNRIHSGFFQQIRQIANPGTYEGYIMDESSQQAIDAYGRATKPIPFSFQTTRPGEYVMFIVDTDRGRASILNNMSPLFSGLAFGQGQLFTSLALLSLAGILFLGLLLRQWVLRNRKFWLEAGCPSCGEHELMRIARRDSDRYLNTLGIPAYRYRCRHCTWEGLRLSEEGAPVSPGVTVTTADIFK